MNTSINQTILDTVLNSTYMMEMDTDFVELKDRQTITIEKVNDQYLVSLHVLPVSRNFKKAKLLAKTKVVNKAELLKSINNMLMDYNGGVIADELNKELLTEYYSDVYCNENAINLAIDDLISSEYRCDWFDDDLVSELVGLHTEIIIDDERYHLPS